MPKRPYIDSHTHTCHFSLDGIQTLDELVSDALSRELRGVIVTEHYDKDLIGHAVQAGISPVGSLPQRDEWVFNIQAYFNLLEEKRRQIQSGAPAFQLLSGIEIGYLPYMTDALDQMIAGYPFDCVILSAHTLDYRDLYDYDALYEQPKQMLYTRYLETLIEMVGCQRQFDVLGHFDYIARKAHYPDNRMLYREMPDHFDELFRRLIQTGRSLELNTRSRYRAAAAGEADIGLPDPDILRRYHELGGELLTLSSDAHATGECGRLFDETADYLLSLGVRFITTFIGRQPMMLQLG